MIVVEGFKEGNDIIWGLGMVDSWSCWISITDFEYASRRFAYGLSQWYGVYHILRIFYALK